MLRAITLLLTSILLIEARLSCKFTGKSQRDILVVCTAVAGGSDYVLRKGLVSDNNFTTGITLRACGISDVDLGAFDNLPALEYIDLSRNKIRRLALGVFDEIRQTRALNISYNELTGFPLGIFDQLPNLEVLDLKGNKIVELELGVLDPMPLLKYVDISSNALVGKNMNPYIFDQSTRIHFMDFSRNDMSESKDILLDAFEELDILNLDRCSLTEVPKFLIKPNLSTIKHLLLSTNKIININDATIFANLDNLEMLNLVGNAIDNIADNVFTPLKRLKIIYLSKNKLKQIPETLFSDLPKLANVDLSHNLIEHVPVNAFRGSPIKNLNLSDNRFTFLSDNFCLELKNSGGGLVKFYFNQNPWQCACLRDILHEVKELHITYNDIKYNGNVPVCVTTEGFNCKRQLSANSEYIKLYYNSIVTT